LVTVVVRGDLNNETDETFFLNLVGPLNAILVDNQGTATILNDDFQPGIVLLGVDLLTEHCQPSNGTLDPDETVSVSFTLRNAASGTATTTNLVARLLAEGGVAAPSEPQNYGALATGAMASRPFTFTAQGDCGGVVTAVLVLEDGPVSVGRLTNVFRLGQRVTVFSENFDGVAAPALPAGWTATAVGAAPWRTITTSKDTAPNSAFATDPATGSTNELTSSPILITTTDAQLAFRHRFFTQLSFDGCALFISIDGTPFRDVVAAGGRFLSGGYTGTIGLGTPAWTGNSGGFTNALVALPADAVGKNIQLRWRLTSDGASSSVGWYVDTISLIDGVACCPPAPPRIEGIQFDGAIVTLRWTAIPGRTYRLQYKPTVDTSEWTDLPGDVIVSGTVALKTDAPADAGQRFYRVMLLR
jgi:hypothetical protein